MKKVLISITTNIYKEILKGENFILLSQLPPSTPFLCYIYVNNKFDKYCNIKNFSANKVVGEFICNDIDFFENYSIVKISDLKIYDKSRELSEFTLFCRDKGKFCKYCSFYVEAVGGCCKTIKRPSQGWQYVEEV